MNQYQDGEGNNRTAMSIYQSATAQAQSCGISADEKQRISRSCRGPSRAMPRRLRSNTGWDWGGQRPSRGSTSCRLHRYHLYSRLRPRRPGGGLRGSLVHQFRRRNGRR